MVPKGKYSREWCEGMVAETAESSHLELKQEKAGNVLSLLKPKACDTPPSTRSHFLILQNNSTC